MSNPFISIIVPIYNVENYLGRCLDSLLAQDYDNYEIICVDDCATDGSGKILREYAEANDIIRAVTYDKNRGLGGARDYGLSQARGDYVFFVDSDDYVEPDLITNYVMALEPQTDIVMGSYYRNTPGEQEFVPTPNSPGAAWVRPSVWIRMYRRGFLLENNLDFRGIRIYEDVPFNYRCLIARPNMVIVDYAGYHYAMNPYSITRHGDGLKRFENIVDNHRKFLEEVDVSSLDEDLREWLEYAFVQNLTIGMLYNMKSAGQKKVQRFQELRRDLLLSAFPDYRANRYLGFNALPEEFQNVRFTLTCYIFAENHGMTKLPLNFIAGSKSQQEIDERAERKAAIERQRIEDAKVEALSLKQNLLWNTIGCLIYQGCQWLTTILVVTLSASYDNSGILAFAMATGNVFTTIATYNMRTYQVSDIGNEFSSRNYVGFRIFTTIAAIVIFAAYTLIVAPNSNTMVAVMVFLLFKADEAFSNVLYGIDQKAGRMDYIGVSQGVRGILTIGGFAGVLMLGGSLTLAILVMFAACVMVTLFYDLPHSRRLSPTSPSINIRVAKTLLVKCAPFVAALFFYGLTATAIRQYFGIAYGEDALGIYAAVATPCVIVQVLANYLYNPFLVSLAEDWTNRNIKALAGMLGKLTLALLAIAGACLFLAFFAGPAALVLLYGHSIADYAWMITPAMLAAFLMATACFLTDFFIVIRSFKVAFALNALTFALCAALMVPFCSMWYMNGINIALITVFAIEVAAGAFIACNSIRKRSQDAV